MKYIKANMAYIDEISNLVKETISTIYPKYYPREVVEFFIDYHKACNIEKDIKVGDVWILFNEAGDLVGTGSREKNHITRMYVAPKFQGKGYGSYIMNQLETEIAQDYDYSEVEASLPASKIYQKRGYQTIQHEEHIVENEVVLAYEIMKKPLYRTQKAISYNGRVFKIKTNTVNGEVDEDTLFYYYQENKVIWAEYLGGAIQKGFLVGKIKEDGKLEFNYQHINKQGEIKIGKCVSQPHLLENGKLEMHETWQWLKDDCSQGQSILVEL